MSGDDSVQIDVMHASRTSGSGQGQWLNIEFLQDCEHLRQLGPFMPALKIHDIHDEAPTDTCSACKLLLRPVAHAPLRRNDLGDVPSRAHEHTFHLDTHFHYSRTRTSYGGMVRHAPPTRTSQSALVKLNCYGRSKVRYEPAEWVPMLPGATGPTTVPATA